MLKHFRCWFCFTSLANAEAKDIKLKLLLIKKSCRNSCKRDAVSIFFGGLMANAATVLIWFSKHLLFIGSSNKKNHDS
jgi:hypothetical protein